MSKQTRFDPIPRELVNVDLGGGLKREGRAFLEGGKAGFTGSSVNAICSGTTRQEVNEQIPGYQMFLTKRQ